MEETVQTIQIYEGAKFGEIFDPAFDLGSFVEMGEEFGAFLVALFFDEFATGENDVLAVFVQFDDSAFESLTEEFT
jgi:hypothetical protein